MAGFYFQVVYPTKIAAKIVCKIFISFPALKDKSAIASLLPQFGMEPID